MKRRNCKICGKYQKSNVCKECKVEQPYQSKHKGQYPFRRKVK